jgi:hypothetical protein
MGPLGIRLARFLNVVQTVAGHEASIVDHLRFPTGYPGIFAGSDLGAALWDTAEGRALLELVREDDLVRQAYDEQAYDGRLGQQDDARRTLANAAAAWSTSGSPPGEFAARVEADVWDSLRRAEVRSAALAIVPHLLAPTDGIQLPHGRNILASSDQFISLILSKQFVNYQIRLPCDPYCIFLANIQASRLDHPTWVGPIMAEIAIKQMKDAVWVSTGLMARIGHLAKFEIHQFPVSEAVYENPERKGDALRGGTDLTPYADDLTRVSARLGVLEGDDPNPRRSRSTPTRHSGRSGHWWQPLLRPPIPSWPSSWPSPLPMAHSGIRTSRTSWCRHVMGCSAAVTTPKAASFANSCSGLIRSETLPPMEVAPPTTT